MAPQARRMAFDGHMSDGAQFEYGRAARSSCALLSTTPQELGSPYVSYHPNPARRDGARGDGGGADAARGR